MGKTSYSNSSGPYARNQGVLLEGLIKIDEIEPLDVKLLAVKENRQQPCESLYGEAHTGSVD
jgi:hypothetical protein